MVSPVDWRGAHSARGVEKGDGGEEKQRHPPKKAQMPPLVGGGQWRKGKRDH